MRREAAKGPKCMQAMRGRSGDGRQVLRSATFLMAEAAAGFAVTVADFTEFAAVPQCASFANLLLSPCTMVKSFWCRASGASPGGSL